MVRFQAAVDGLGHCQAALGSGVGKGCLRGSTLLDGPGAAGRCRYEAVSAGLFYLIAYSGGQTGGRSALAVLQSEGGNAACEDHLPIGTGDGPVIQSDCESKFFFLIGCRAAYNALCDCKTAGLSGVGKLSFGASPADRSGRAGHLSGEACRCRFRYCVGDICGKTFCCHALSALQFHGGSSFFEGNSAVGTVYGSIAQRDGEGEDLVSVSCLVGYDFLADLQISRLSGIGEGCGCCLFGTDGTGFVRLVRDKACRGCFRYGVRNTCRKSLRRPALAVLQLYCGCALSKGHVTIDAADGLIAQCDGEGEGLVAVSRPVGYDFLADLEISGLSGVGEGRCGNGLADRTGLSSKCRHEQVVSSFFYLVADALRKAFRHAGFAV